MPQSGLSLNERERDPEPLTEPAPSGTGAGLAALAVLLVAGQGALVFFGYRMHQRTIALERQVAVLSEKADAAARQSQEAQAHALSAAQQATAAAQGRQVAEAQSESERQQAEAARQDASTARQTAEQAQAEAAKVKAQAEAEINRLQSALGQIAETKRTALGLVMNLSGDHLKFEFDKADLKPEDRELLSRIAGILMTATDTTISVNGYTDDVGSDDYNQKLSLRRAQAVRDYLVAAGLPPGIFSVDGHGKSLPLVKGTSEEARAKNRRVELGIANVNIKFGRP